MTDRNRNPDGTYDGVGVMSDLTGLSRKTVQEQWEAVKVNAAKLAGCPRHQFAPIGVAAVARRFRCAACGGEVSRSDVRWYEDGLRHASAQ